MIFKFSCRALAALLGLTLTACGGSGGGEAEDDAGPPVVVQAVPAAQQRIIPTEEAFPYRSDGLFSDVLKDCALISEDEDICKLAELPHIGHAGQSPGVEDVMQRVLVTHDWMGARFEQALHRMPPDMLALFGTVTSIVIGSELRPSSYFPGQAKIQLDPRFLWVTVPEKRTIATDDDFRTNFGAALKFKGFRRLAIGNDYAVPFSSLSDDNPRAIEELDIPLASLLYHELAHANDYIQYDTVASVSLDQTPWQAVQQNPDLQIWQQLYDDEQLTAQSSWLYGLARVRFRDDEPTPFLASLLADFVGGEMGNEGKASFYGYFTRFEDVATLFSAAMMKYHYDVDTHVGFANKTENEATASCNDYKVAWGVRNRVAAPLVAPRAQFIVDKMLPPSANRDQFFASGMGTETPLRLGVGWCDSVSDDPILAKTKNSDRKPVELYEH